MATDQQGVGTALPVLVALAAAATYTDFFQVNGTGRTFGLLQASSGLPTPDPQWPFAAGANFAVNPVNGQDVVISSSVGRIFSTTNEGVTWFDIGDPAVFGSPGSFSVALAYGAPDPSAPEGVGNLGNFIYVGTATGQIYVTQDGGGSGTSNNWINISTGLDGSPSSRSSPTPPAAATTPTPSPPPACSSWPTRSPRRPIPLRPGSTSPAISTTWRTPSSARPTTRRPTRTPSSSTRRSPVARSWPTGDTPSPMIANDPSTGYHPVLYVGSNSGVYQSLDDGQTWTLFPDTTYGAVTEGGYLPHVAVTDLSLSLGNIDPNTGMPNTGRSVQPQPATDVAGDRGPRRPAGHDLRPRRVRHQPGAA